MARNPPWKMWLIFRENDHKLSPIFLKSEQSSWTQLVNAHIMAILCTNRKTYINQRHHNGPRLSCLFSKWLNLSFLEERAYNKQQYGWTSTYSSNRDTIVFSKCLDLEHDDKAFFYEGNVHKREEMWEFNLVPCRS